MLGSVVGAVGEGLGLAVEGSFHCQGGQRGYQHDAGHENQRFGADLGFFRRQTWWWASVPLDWNSKAFRPI